MAKSELKVTLVKLMSATKFPNVPKTQKVQSKIHRKPKYKDTFDQD